MISRCGLDFRVERRENVSSLCYAMSGIGFGDDDADADADADGDDDLRPIKSFPFLLESPIGSWCGQWKQ